MPSLSPAELRSKLIFDNKLVRALSSPHVDIRAYGSVLDARAGRELKREAEHAGSATVYDVTYSFPIKVDEHRTIPSATARFDLLGGGDFPKSMPLVQFIDRELPWTPHVSLSGMVCIGAGWVERVTAFCIIHVMRLLNFDEPRPGPEYAGYNVVAIDWWRRVLEYRPLYPDLQYPVIPTALTHGSAVVRSRAPAFRIVEDEPAFRVEEVTPGKPPEPQGFLVLEE